MTLRSFSKWLAKTLPFWGASLLIGAIAVGYAHIFKIVEQFSQQLFMAHPFVMLVFTPACFLCAWGLVKLAPTAKGSGLPQVMTAVVASKRNHIDLLDRLINMKTAIIKILSSIVCVLGGGAVGREGPTAQIGASLFYAIGQWFEKKGIKKISPDIWIVAGSSAGIAAAFNTPLGGIVFAIEELSQGNFHKLKLKLIGAVITAGLVAQALAGPYLYLGYPVLQPLTPEGFLWAIGFGILAGISGAVFAVILYKLIQQTKKIKPLFFPVFVVAMGVCVALIGINLGILSIGAGREALIALLFNHASIDWKIALARFITPLLTYISGVSGGVFAPSLSVGGCLGYLFATLFHIPNVSLFIMLGMIGFLTGVTRAPFTSFVLVLEMTNRHDVIFPMMIIALLASFAANRIDPRSFYSKVKRDYWTSK